MRSEHRRRDRPHAFGRRRDGDKAADEIAAATGNACRGMACDVTNKDDIDAVVAATAVAFGGISTLVNNVGWGGRQEDPSAITEEEFVDSTPSAPIG